MKLPLTRRFDHSQSLNIFTVGALGTVLVLLIIFIVITPSHRETQPSRPFIRTAVNRAATERDLNVSVLANGRILVGREYVADDTLRAVLTRINHTTPERPFILEADQSVDYSRINVVLRAARDAGFTEVLLVTGAHDALEGIQRSAERP